MEKQKHGDDFTGKGKEKLFTSNLFISSIE